VKDIGGRWGSFEKGASGQKEKQAEQFDIRTGDGYARLDLHYLDGEFGKRVAWKNKRGGKSRGNSRFAGKHCGVQPKRGGT